MDLQAPIPPIDVAVSMRDLSAYQDERTRAERLLPGPVAPFHGDRGMFLKELKGAFHAAMIVTYAQGLALLRRASAALEYGLDLATVARIWRGGCIIRAALLETIRAAYQQQHDLPNLLLDTVVANRMAGPQVDLRAVTCAAGRLGVPVLGLMAALGYYDSYRSARL